MGLVTALIQALNADRFDVSFSLSLSLCPDKGVCWEKDERHARQGLFKSKLLRQCIFDDVWRCISHKMTP